MDRQTPIIGVGVPRGCPLGQDLLPVYKSLLWKIKKQLALTHPIYYQVVAAGELNKRQGAVCHRAAGDTRGTGGPRQEMEAGGSPPRGCAHPTRVGSEPHTGVEIP